MTATIETSNRGKGSLLFDFFIALKLDSPKYPIVTSNGKGHHTNK